MGNWVSVKDRIPDIEVIACGFQHGIMIGYIYWDESYKEYRAENDCEILTSVTHWMPLPEPPKEDV